MQCVEGIINNFLKPYLSKHHPHADIVIIAGSYGRAMKQGGYQPLASSDIDLVIIYSDLEKDGFKAATQIFSMEDAGKALGGESRIMMIDTNIHDFATLHYHDKVVREVTGSPFTNRMIEEGYILIDKTGLGPVLQQKATQFLEAGPLPAPQSKWHKETLRLESFLHDIRTAGSVEEKRFLGVMCLTHACNYVFEINKSWRTSINQSYRVLKAHFPEDEVKIREGFSALIRHGDSSSVEKTLEEYIVRGKALLPLLPVADRGLLYPIDKFIPKDELANMNGLFHKFVAEHVCSELESSQKRGELAYLENLSAAVMFFKAALEAKNGETAGESSAGMRYFSMKFPDILPVMLQAIDDHDHEPLRKLADGLLDHVGGIHYTRMENYLPDDMARVYASQAASNAKASRAWFKPGFSP